MTLNPSEFPDLFPNLKSYEKTSDQTAEYNCIAHACGYDDRWSWPGSHWPKGFGATRSVRAFKTFFGIHGYAPCADGSLEAGWEKVAIYASGDTTQHAARQLESGEWTSKLGQGIDIKHPDPGSLEGPRYGRVVMFLRRQRPTMAARP